LAASALKRVKVTVGYADLSVAAFTNTVTLLELPAGAAVKDVYADLTEAFTAPVNNHVLTVNGTNLGICTVASATDIPVGAYVGIIDNDTGETHGYVVDKTVASPTVTRLHIQNAASGGVDVDLSNYTVDQAAHVYFDLSAVVMQAGIVGTTDKYLVAGQDMFTAPAEFIAAALKGATIKTPGDSCVESFSAVVNVVAKFDATGALFNQLDEGSIDFYIEYVDLS
jgi:hypothetical protein